jgi:hypothetical protein
MQICKRNSILKAMINLFSRSFLMKNKSRLQMMKKDCFSMLLNIFRNNLTNIT